VSGGTAVWFVAGQAPKRRDLSTSSVFRVRRAKAPTPADAVELVRARTYCTKFAVAETSEDLVAGRFVYREGL